MCKLRVRVRECESSYCCVDSSEFVRLLNTGIGFD